MRLSASLSIAVAALSVGCSVPDVQFSPDGPDATTDANEPQETGGGDGPLGADAPGDGLQASSDDGGADAGDDSPYDGPLYCEDGGPPPPGGKCCPMNGPPCSGACNMMACAACGACSSPRICCTTGSSGTCKIPPC